MKTETGIPRQPSSVTNGRRFSFTSPNCSPSTICDCHFLPAKHLCLFPLRSCPLPFLPPQDFDVCKHGEPDKLFSRLTSIDQDDRLSRLSVSNKIPQVPFHWLLRPKRPQTATFLHQTRRARATHYTPPHPTQSPPSGTRPTPRLHTALWSPRDSLL